MVPGDYLKLTMNMFKETSSDNFKADRLSNGFATNSKADEWYEALPAATQADWKLLKAEFLRQWPWETVRALNVEQHRARLRAEKLRKEDIGKVVQVRGLPMTGHVAWANRILALSAQVDDPSGAMIHEIREAMPVMMKKIVTGTFKTYKDFCNAVKAVDDDAIAIVMEEIKSLMRTLHADILALFEEEQLDNSAPGTEQPEITVDDDASIFTRHTDPFNPACIAKILEVVEIGEDISIAERGHVEAIIHEHADVYAL
ncbi:hypothetical protein B0H14DRAFT_3481717 [Mycena olivaceomarginata]|nr:hypothetical protein B0H14DRAFT_3481717 [Mycena olivaceomarginata]